MDIKQVFEWADTLGVIALLLIIIGTGARRVWVWGYQLTDAVVEAGKRESALVLACQKWQNVAEANQQQTDKLIQQVEELLLLLRSRRRL